MIKENHNFWNTFEVWCICRDFKYDEYIQKHTELQLVHRPLSKEGYEAMWKVFNDTIEGNISEQLSENPFAE